MPSSKVPVNLRRFEVTWSKITSQVQTIYLCSTVKLFELLTFPRVDVPNVIIGALFFGRNVNGLGLHPRNPIDINASYMDMRNMKFSTCQY